MRRRYVVTYDICDPRRLRRVFKVLRDWGDHLQLSVFECHLNTMEVIQLKDAVNAEIHAGEDQVLFIDLGAVDRAQGASVTCLGRPYAPRPNGPVIV